MRQNIFIIVIIIALLVLPARTIGRVLDEALPGSVDKPPLNVVVIFVFSPPPVPDKLPLDTAIFRIFYSELYELLDYMEDSPSLVSGLAISPRLVDYIKYYSNGGTDVFLEGETGEEIKIFYKAQVNDTLQWNLSWLPEEFKNGVKNLNDVKEAYKDLASALLGKLIGLKFAKRISVIAMPDFSVPLDVLFKNGMIDLVHKSFGSSLENFVGTFGKVETFYPPLLSLSGSVIKILKTKGFKYTFVSKKDISGVSYIEDLIVIPVDTELSHTIENANTLKDLINVFSELHKRQSQGEKLVVLKINALNWLLNPEEIKKEFLNALKTDRFIKLLLPEELRYDRLISYLKSFEYGEPDNWLESPKVRKVWNTFLKLYDTYLRSLMYLSDEKKAQVAKLLEMLIDQNFLKISEYDGMISTLFSEFYRRILNYILKLLGEDAANFTLDVLEENTIFLERIDTESFNLNGVDDEGFWKYTRSFKKEGSIVDVKLVLLKNHLGILLKFNDDITDLLGKAYVLELQVNDTLYRWFLKFSKVNLWVFEKEKNSWVLRRFIKNGVGIWNDVVEIYVKLDKTDDVKLKITFEDARTHVKIWRMPDSGYLRLISE